MLQFVLKNYVYIFRRHNIYVCSQEISSNYRFVDSKLFDQDPGNWNGAKAEKAKEKVNKNNALVKKIKLTDNIICKNSPFTNRHGNSRALEAHRGRGAGRHQGE